MLLNLSCFNGQNKMMKISFFLSSKEPIKRLTFPSLKLGKINPHRKHKSHTFLLYGLLAILRLAFIIDSLLLFNNAWPLLQLVKLLILMGVKQSLCWTLQLSPRSASLLYIQYVTFSGLGTDYTGLTLPRLTTITFINSNRNLK